MTTQPPADGARRRPSGPRDPGDAWVLAPSGERYWGRYGAAGLLALDPDRGVLLQHRVGWSHFGGTWALPGGARHEGESAADAALREAGEEAGVPRTAIRSRLVSVLDVGVWTYTTVVGDVVMPFEPAIGDEESLELAWVPVDQVSGRPLHPGFAESWQRLRPLLGVRPAVLVDAANVVGAVPDGWWNDRVGATERLLGRIAALAERGVPAAALGLPGSTWFAEWVVVVEGRATAVGDQPGLEVVRASGVGDDAMVTTAQRLRGAGRQVTAVTSDRALTARLIAVGATVRGARWLLDGAAG